MQGNNTVVSSSGEVIRLNQTSEQQPQDLQQQQQQQQPVQQEEGGLPIFTIPAEKMPGGFSLSFQEPTYGERKKFVTRYPGVNSKCGYSIDELLIANKIIEINGQDWNSIQGEPIARWRMFSLPDSQYITTVFSSLFLMTQELADSAEVFANELKKQGKKDIYTIPKEKMPNQKFSVSFRRARSGDRMDAERRYPGMESNCGYAFEELFYALCIDFVDGQPARKPSDVVSLMDEWTTIDQMFSMAVFINIATLDRDEQTDGRELGKSLRAQLLKTDSNEQPQPTMDFV